jgi:hypothetical protein
MRRWGGRCLDTSEISRDLWRCHAYLTSSRAKSSVAKHACVRARCGWFSDRSERYLSAGRPVVVQDPRFRKALPAGLGLLAWSTVDEAFDAVRRAERDYADHAPEARTKALDHFDAQTVLSHLLSRL